MLNELDYVIGWCVYMVAVSGCLGVFWYMTRKLPWQVFKECLRLIVAVLVLVPAVVEPTLYYAPAWLVGAFELLTGNTEQANIAFSWIGKWLAFSLLIYFFLFVISHLLSAKQTKAKHYPKNNKAEASQR